MNIEGGSLHIVGIIPATADAMLYVSVLVLMGVATQDASAIAQNLDTSREVHAEAEAREVC